MLWKDLGYKLFKESFEEKTKTGRSLHVGGEYPEDVNDVNNDTLVNPTTESMDQLSRKLKDFINTSTITKRAEVKANKNNSEDQDKGRYSHTDLKIQATRFKQKSIAEEENDLNLKTQDVLFEEHTK